MQAFGTEIVPLTGTTAQVEAAEREYRVYAAKHPNKAGGYDMDHSSIIYVMAPDGHYAGLLDDTMSPTDLAAHLRQLGV